MQLPLPENTSIFFTEKNIFKFKKDILTVFVCALMRSEELKEKMPEEMVSDPLGIFDWLSRAQGVTCL